MLNSSIAAIAHQAGEGRRLRLSMIRDRLSSGRQRFLGDRRERRAQQLALIGEGGDALGDIWMIAQIGGDFRLPLRFEDTIDIGVEIIFRDRPMVHFRLRSVTTFFGASAAPSISCCSLSRARDKPRHHRAHGMFSTFAASA